MTDSTTDRPEPDHLVDEAIRGFLLTKHLPFDQLDAWTDEIMDIVREHDLPVAALQAEVERLRTRLADAETYRDKFHDALERSNRAAERRGKERDELRESSETAWSRLATVEIDLAVAHDVIRRLRDGWKASTDCRIWMSPFGAHRDEPVTPEQRALLDAVAGPNDTEENR